MDGAVVPSYLKYADRPQAAATASGEAAGPTLAATDPRWVLALRVQESMQGELLTGDARERLHKLGRLLGLTAFEVSLVIAIVQDEVRRGGPLGDAAASLAMVPQHQRATRRHGNHRWRVAAWSAAVLAVEVALILLAF